MIIFFCTFWKGMRPYGLDASSFIIKMQEVTIHSLS